MNSIWTIDVLLQFNASTVPCEMCDGERRRTQSVATIDPFGNEYEQYSICDSPDCLQKLEELTIGDGRDAPDESGQTEGGQ